MKKETIALLDNFFNEVSFEVSNGKLNMCQMTENGVCRVNLTDEETTFPDGKYKIKVEYLKKVERIFGGLPKDISEMDGNIVFKDGKKQVKFRLMEFVPFKKIDLPTIFKTTQEIDLGFIKEMNSLKCNTITFEVINGKFIAYENDNVGLAGYQIVLKEGLLGHVKAKFNIDYLSKLKGKWDISLATNEPLKLERDNVEIVIAPLILEDDDYSDEGESKPTNEPIIEESSEIVNSDELLKEGNAEELV